MSTILRKQQLRGETVNTQRLDAIMQLTHNIQAMKTDIEHLKISQPKPHLCEVRHSDIDEIVQNIEHLEAIIEDQRKEAQNIKDEIYENLENAIVEKVISETPRANFDFRNEEVMKQIHELTERIEQLEKRNNDIQQSLRLRQHKIILTREGVKEAEDTDKPVINKIKI